MTEVARYNFFLNTLNRTSGTVSNAVFTLSYPITLTNDANYFQCSFINCVVPFSFKTIHDDNHTILHNTIFQAGIGGSPVDWTMTITNGNYNIIEFCQVIQDAINAEIKAYNPLSTCVCVITFQDDTGIVTISLSTDLVYGPTTIFLNFTTYPYMGRMIGFPTNVTIVSGTPQNSPNHYNIAPIMQCFLRSSKLLTRNFEFLIENQQNPSDIVYCFNILTTFDSYLNSNNINTIISRIYTKTIYEIDLYLTSDADYVALDTGGLPFFTTMLLQEMQPPGIERLTQLGHDIAGTGVMKAKDDEVKEPELPTEASLGGGGAENPEDADKMAQYQEALAKLIEAKKELDTEAKHITN